MHNIIRRILPAMVLGVLILPANSAPGPKTESKPDKVAASEAIRKALNTSGKFEFAGVTLVAVLNTLSEQYKINIVLDRTAMLQMGLEPELMNVELKSKESKLSSALRSMIGQYNLTFAIVGDSLLISTEEMAVYRQLKQRINVDFDNVPLNKALKEMATQYGVNVIIDPRSIKSKAAENPITLQVDDVPFEAAVRLMCEMADLKPARMGNVIFVTTEARADKLKDGDSLVPTPRPILPDGLLLGGAAGGLGGIPQVNPPAIVLPAVPDKAEAPKEQKKD